MLNVLNVLILRCPKCGHTMKYQQSKGSRATDIGDKVKKKRCVYCGFTFDVKGHVVRAEP